MLASLYNGNVHVWNHENQSLVKSFEVCDLPVRAAKFVPRKNWVVTGSDDMQVSFTIREVLGLVSKDHFCMNRFEFITTTLWRGWLLLKLTVTT